MRDILGNEIEAGNWVAYATRSGNTGKLTVGKVEQVKGDRIKVVGVETDWDTPKARRLQRASWLLYSDRIIRLDAAHTMPLDYLALFK